MIDIDNYIRLAIKDQEKDLLRTYRALKTAFMEYRTAKNAKPLDEAAQYDIIRKMIKERLDNVEIYNEAGRLELAAQEQVEASILQQFLPSEPDYEDIEAYALEIMTDKDPKKMGLYIKQIKEQFPTASGKTVADCVKSLM